MDEATSALDSEAEETILRVINRMKLEGKTIIMIAHRLSTVLTADTIFVMDAGKVVEQGVHKDLYSLRGKYFKMWQKQLPQSIMSEVF